MKNKLLIGLTAIATTGILVGCSDTFGPGNEKQGRIFPTVGLNTDVVSSDKAPSAPRSRAAQSITPSQLALDLLSADGSVHNHWESADEFPAGEDWPVGQYSMEATYGNPDEEGFGKPYYYGKADFSVKDNATTPVSITAQLANSMVTVTFTDNFKKFFQSYSAELLTANDGHVEYPVDATEPCYVKPGSVSLELKVKKFTGTEATLTPASFTAQARHHYKLVVDVNAQSGEGFLTLMFDELLDKEDVTLDLSDELINAPAPTMTPKGFTNGQDISFIAGSAPTDPLKLTLIAHGGISSVIMKTTSTSLSEQGWPAEIDLAAGDAAASSTLSSLGLTTLGLNKNPEKMAVVDLTEVVRHIEYIEGVNNTSTFTFKARDQYGKESEEVSLSLTLNKLEMVLSNPSTIYDGDTQITLTLTYNGTSTDNIKFQTRGANGKWADTEATVVPASRASQAYTVTATIPAEGDLYISALLQNTRSNELALTRVASPYKLVVNNNDVFATHATLNLAENTVISQSHGRRVLKAADASKATLQLSSDGKSWSNASPSVSGSEMKLTGLTAAKEYYARAVVDNVPTKPVTFTTETILQLPNAGMETWFTVAGGTDNWWIEYPGANQNAVWGTMNLLTTSEGGNRAGTAPGAAYCAFSGTRKTTDYHGGASAAIISTVGWGSGNTAWLGQIGSGIKGGKCNNVTAGELYLGTYDSASKKANYSGYEFASRPSSMTFYYKYVAKNSADYGWAEIRMLDASGNVFASQTTQLTAAGSYGAKTVALSYAAGAPKAAKIVVIFKSSGNSSCLVANNDNMSSPPSANLSDGRYTGSELYIDDITLNY
ncbi:MAG: DUF4493 domain-containing protein [Muribaculaceae bacterium]|nr:DUF4493 domain-containing protein [Muribaculaceae bacterium]